MSNTNMSRRLKRIESELAPPSDKPGVMIILSSPGKPDEIIEMPSVDPLRRRRMLRIPGQGEKDSGVNAKTIPG